MIPLSITNTKTFMIGEKCINVFEPSKRAYITADASTIFVIGAIIEFPKHRLQSRPRQLQPLYNQVWEETTNLIPHW